jgi:hypothetical protein
MNRKDANKLGKLLLFLWLITIVACTQSGPPELEQAADVVGDMLKPINLSRSMYSVAFPNGRPSQFVSYMFSTMGSAEWPPSEEWVDEIEREQMAAIGQTLIPAGVAIVPQTPDSDLGKQLVVTFDNDRAVVIAHGYEDPVAEPVVSREWKIPQVEPAIGIREIYEANLEEGLSPQSFPAP